MDRPQTTQNVINAFSAILDAQDIKGLEKYGVSIDEAKNENYDWNVMALEEAADLFKYLVKENEKLRLVAINTLCAQAYETAKSKGWHEEERETGTLLALIHSEVSEALEADRKGDKENFAEELADVCIRIFDLCGLKNIDLEKAILEKMERNKSRTYKHGGKNY